MKVNLSTIKMKNKLILKDLTPGTVFRVQGIDTTYTAMKVAENTVGVTGVILESNDGLVLGDPVFWKKDLDIIEIIDCTLVRDVE